MESTLISFSPKEQVIRSVTNLISSRELPPESQLPAENALALQLGVSRGTVRSGLAELTERGVLEKRGRRLHVASTPRRNGAPATGLMGRTIALLGLADAVTAIRKRNTGYIDAIQAGAMDEAASRRLNTLTLNMHTLQSQDIEELTLTPPAGLLVFPQKMDLAAFDEVVDRLESLRVPVVVFGSRRIREGLDTVMSDHAAGCRLLTECLIRRGFRRICCYLSPKDDADWTLARRGGYQDAMRAAGLDPVPYPQTAYYGEDHDTWSRERFAEETRRAAGHLLELYGPGSEGPEAILARTDWDVPVLAAALRLLGREPGREVVLVGYDHKEMAGDWVDMESCRPVLTVDKRNAAIGRRMVQRLIERIQSPSDWQPRCFPVEPELIDNQ